MRKILITGGGGRIAKKLVPHLISRGWDVTAVARNGVNEGRYEHNVIIGDVFNSNFMANILPEHDAVIHLACSSIPAESEIDQQSDLERNLFGTINLFRQSQKAGVKLFLFPSSGGSVYGNPGQDPVSEDYPQFPISYHGAMKLATEHYLHASIKYGMTRCVILRIGNPYGLSLSKHNQGLIDIFAHRFRQGLGVEIWGDGTVVRDYLYVDDLLSAFSTILEGKPSQFVYNIGSGKGATILDVLAELGKHFDLKDKVHFKAHRSLDVNKIILDISRINKDLNWSPKIGLAQGIERLSHNE